MCKPGDIIVIKKYTLENGLQLSRHSFVVLSTETGEIKGMEFDLVTSVMSSFNDEKHKTKKLKYEENFHVTVDDYDSIQGNDKDGYIKADQLFYFEKEKIDYINIGAMDAEVFRKLLKLIEELDKKGKVKNVLNNLFK